MYLGIGTAQFGLDYGISNRDGRVRRAEVQKILKLACRSSIRYIDTAPLYGTSESMLGSSLPDSHHFRIVSKTVNLGHGAIRFVQEAICRSLQRLRQRRLYGLLVHRVNDLLGPEGKQLWETLDEVKTQGLVSKIGASVYTTDELDAVVDRYRIDIVQIPLNVFDQRFASNGFLEALKNANIEIHVRSIFLQGLLLMKPENLPGYFSDLREKIASYQTFLSKHELTPLQGALLFVSLFSQIECGIVGVCSSSELKEICQSLPRDPVDLNFRQFAINDDPRIDPRNWIL